MLVIDIDGPANPWPGQLERLADLNNAPVSNTPRGGRHHIFRQPPGKNWRNTESRLASRVDTRGEGGYIVVPPSVIGDQRYHWRDGLALSCSPQTLPLPPDWLIRRLDALKRRAGPTPPPESNSDRRDLSKYVQVALDAEVGKVAMANQGMRNATLNNAAFALGQLIGAGAIDRFTVEGQLAEAAARCGLPERESTTTIRSGLDAGIAQPRRMPPTKRSSRRQNAKGVADSEQNAAADSTIIVTPAEHIVNAAAVRSIAKDMVVFQRGGQLVRIVRDPATFEVGGITRQRGTPRIAALSQAIVRDRLAANAEFVKKSPKGELIPTSPPDWCVAAVTEYGDWPVRVLEGVVDCPVLRPDGTILSIPGYDRHTGLFLEPGGPRVLVPDQPIRDDVDAALELLLDVIADFPFASEAHRAAFVAALLTPLARQVFSGPSPLFAIDSNVRGAGKGLAAEIIGLIVSGRPMPAPVSFARRFRV